MKFTGTQPAGNGRTGRRIKELQKAVRSLTIQPGQGTLYRRGPGGTVLISQPGQNKTQGSTLTWLA